MTPPGADEVVERVVVIEHPAFEQLYQDALGLEGVTPDCHAGRQHSADYRLHLSGGDEGP